MLLASVNDLVLKTYSVDNPDDHDIGRRFLDTHRHRSGAALLEDEHSLVDSSTHGIDRNQLVICELTLLVDVSLPIQIKEPRQGRPALFDHIVSNMTEFSDYCRSRDSDDPVQPYGGGNLQPCNRKAGALCVNHQVAFEPHTRNCATYKGNNDMLVCAQRFAKAYGRSHL